MSKLHPEFHPEARNNKRGTLPNSSLPRPIDGTLAGNRTQARGLGILLYAAPDTTKYPLYRILTQHTHTRSRHRMPLAVGAFHPEFHPAGGAR